MRRVSRLAWIGIVCLGFTGGTGTAAPEDPASDGIAPRAIARMERLLEDPDRGVRYAAVVALGKGGAAPDIVARGLRDPERCVRYEAAWWLRRAGAVAWPTLDGALADPAPPVRAAAAWALSSFGAEAVPRLRRALDDADPETVLEAVAATRRLGRDLAKPLLDGIRAKAVAAHAEPMPEVDDDMDPPTVARIAAAAAALKEKRRELDATLAVLDPPPPKVEPPAPAAPPAGPTAAEPVPGDAPPEPPRPPDPALAEPALAMPTIDRVDAVLGLGAGPDDLAALDRALADPERDVRIAAVLALDRASGDVVPRLVRGLDDPNPRVRRAALRALGRRGTAPDRTARFLDDPSLPTSSEARRALTTAGGAGAAAAAERMRAGGYAALHHGLLLFEELGAGGAPAVPTLAAMLADPDPNVREIAARCLFHVGRGAAPAAPALLAALGDRRLCVIAHAALALGRIGLTEPLLAATAAPSARVRAYAAWAVAWALGEARAVDQVAYEARLPVLDVGATGPFPTAEEVHEVVTPAWRTHDDDEAAAARAEAVRLERLRRAIWAKDPAIAVVAAAALEADDVDVVEAERVMELVLPEGVRDGSPVEFGSLRRLVGTNEVPACVVYAARMRATSDARSSIYGNFHRMSRAEMLPFLAWFDRVEEPEVLEHVGELWQPDDRTLRYARERMGWRAPDDVPAAGDGDLARRAVRDCLEDSTFGLGAPGLWLVREFTPRAGDAPTLLACARMIVETRPKWSHTEYADAWVLLGALGRLGDDASLEFLTGVATGGDTDETTALVAEAAIARRGGPAGAAAIRTLVERSRDDWDAWTLLVAVAPRAGARALCARLLAEKDLVAWDGAIGGARALVENAYRLGVRIPPDALLGLEAEVVRAVPSAQALATAAVRVPGLRTRRVATRLLELLEAETSPPSLLEEEPGPWWNDEVLDETIGFLLGAEPVRTTALLRRWAAPPVTMEAAQVARGALLRLGDRPSLAMLLPWLRAPGGERGSQYADLDTAARLRLPEVVQALRAWIEALPPNHEDRNELLRALVVALGWPDEAWVDVEQDDDVPAERQAEVVAAVLRGDLGPLRAAYLHPEKLPGPGERPVWKRIGRAAAAGDREARGAFWSAMRAARYKWVHYHFEPWLQTLGRDPSTLPHWAEDLDSNCCRISDGLAHDAFEGNYGLPDLYDRHREGVGGPLSAFVADWMDLAAGDWVWSPHLGRFLPAPE